MIAEIGHYALVLALVLALVQGTLPMIGAARGDARMIALAGPTAVGQFGFVALAFIALMQAFVVSDFSVLNVAQNSHSAKPMLYKIAGVWGNHEGSLVLWVLILTVYGLAVAVFGGNLPSGLKARVLAIQGLIGAGFLSFILFASNPFVRSLPAPAEGAGLNPLLQDPGLAFHPPFLYLGYVGFSMAFSFAVAALIEGRVDAAWARWVRPWTLAAWSALTLGIALGSWWAYYELGWGGWWFWDPVENASLMPWLAGTALLHSATVVEKRGALKSWTIFLAILAFALSLLGTFLVRSGILTSVHAFATDPGRGIFVLSLFALVVGGSLTLFAVRAPALKGGGLFAPISREGALVLNNLGLATAAAVVLLGTLYPVVLDALGGSRVSVGPPFFEATIVPLMVPMLAAVAIGPMLGWKRCDLAGALGRLKFVFAAALITAFVVWYPGDRGQALAALGIALAVWLIAGAALELGERLGLGRIAVHESLRRARNLPRAAFGMSLAHAGLGIFIAGVTASSAWQTEKVQLMRPGDSVDIAGYAVTFEGAGEVAGPNYTATRARFRIERSGVPIAMMSPEKRYYPAEGSATTEAAIRTTWLADLYVVLGEPTGDGAYATRLYHNPLVPWIWTGVLVMASGGLVSLTDRRHRVGAPVPAARRRRTPASAPPAPAAGA